MTGPGTTRPPGEGADPIPSDPAVSDLGKVAAGDVVAFQQLYRTTSATLFGICTRILREPGEAEEALQDVYVAIWRRAATFDPARGSAKAWMATLARNCAVDRLRTRSRVAATPLDYADEIADERPLAPDLIERRQERTKLEDCLELLAPGDIGLIRTAFFEGSSYSELAIRTDRPLGTVKSRIRRALLKLADCLQ